MIGDCHSAALVSARGSLDWACLRRFDSGGVFCRLLDAGRGGSFRFHIPDLVRTHRSYLEDTNVLETVFETPNGRARVLDAFTMRKGGRRSPHQQLVRVVEGLEGRVSIEVSIEPRFDYGGVLPEIRHHPGPGVFSAVGADQAIVLGAGCPLEIDCEHARLTGRFTITARRRCRFSLVGSLAHDMSPVRVRDRTLDQRLARTIAWWRAWVARGHYGREHRSAVVRSALVLKALTCAPTGAIVAAPTTSLPEVLGGERNWDYRFSWIRDSTLTLSALFAVGHRDVAHGFKRFIERTAGGRVENLQIMYGCYGERHLPEVTLPHLDGYRGSRPVRAGNAAATQTQLDVYGELVDLGHLFSQMGAPISEREWRFLRALVEVARRRWSEPDQGLWEMRGPPRHFVHSKVMCWVALDRGIELAEQRALPCDLEGWKRSRDEVREAVERRGVDPERGCYVQAFDSRELDASLLLLPIVGYVEPRNPRMLATVEHVERELSAEHGLLRRYRSAVDDGLEGEEGAFLMVSFWLAEVLAMQGRLAEAEARFRHLLTMGNDLQLFAEEYRPGVGQLGNFPQAFTHVAIIGAAQQIAETRAHGPWGRSASGHRAAIRDERHRAGARRKGDARSD